jgi:hypothetical protein
MVVYKNLIIGLEPSRKIVDMRNSINISHNLKNAPNQWAQIMAEIIDKLVGTKTSITIKFEDLKIDVPIVKGPDGNDLGSAKWILDGKILLTTIDTNQE